MNRVCLFQLSFYQQYFSRYKTVAPNIYPSNTYGEMDILCIRKSGYVDEIEIKLTKSDFNADFNKTVKSKKKTEYGYKYVKRNKHRLLRSGKCIPNYFSFLVPEKLANEIEIPKYCGLYTISEDNRNCILEIKKAPILHKEKEKVKNLEQQIGMKMMYRYWNEIKKRKERR